jgi:hypothetical protein
MGMKPKNQARADHRRDRDTDGEQDREPQGRPGLDQAGERPGTDAEHARVMPRRPQIRGEGID